MSKTTNTTGDLRVWHIPQIPGKPFHVTVASVEQAKLVLSVLANYDIFQFKNRIKPDYSNASGLDVFQDGDWWEWEDKDGNTINETEATT